MLRADREAGPWVATSLKAEGRLQIFELEWPVACI